MVLTGATVPQILAGEPVQTTPATGSVFSMSSGTVASGAPIIDINGTYTTRLVGVASTTSNESSVGGSLVGSGNGVVSVTPIDEPLTYLISTLDTATFFGGVGAGSQVCATAQAAYDANVGKRLLLVRIGGTSAKVQAAGQQYIGGTYYISGSDSVVGGCVVEELDVVKFPGKVRFSFRNALSYRA